MLKRMPRVESSRTGESHCGSHCHDRTAAPPLPIALPLRHCLFNTPHAVAGLPAQFTPGAAAAAPAAPAAKAAKAAKKAKAAPAPKKATPQVAEATPAATGPSREKSASRSLRRALLMPLVNPGSRYRYGKRT